MIFAAIATIFIFSLYCFRFFAIIFAIIAATIIATAAIIFAFHAAASLFIAFRRCLFAADISSLTLPPLRPPAYASRYFRRPFYR